MAERRLCALGIDARVFEGDVRRMSFEDESFDLVVDFGTCYHVSGGVTGSRAALREVCRVLRPGGWFVDETRIAQLLAHPIRSSRRAVPGRNVATPVFDSETRRERRGAEDYGKA
jgi:SAM-dependent methyltransferase